MIKDIVYATDERYAPLMSVSLASLFLNNENLQLSIHIIDNNISSSTREIIKSYVENHGSTCEFITISDYSCLSSHSLEVHKLSLSTYSRLLLANVLPDSIESVLYIDCDTIVNDSLYSLLSTDIEGYGVAGVEDAIDPIEKEKLGIDQTVRYLNAGILLLNLKYWRENNLFSKFTSFIDKFNGKVPFLDQGIINGVINERIVLPLRYNVQAPIYAVHSYGRLLKYFNITQFYSEKEYLESKLNPAIIHFTSFYIGRPWISGCSHPLKDLYIKYEKSSPLKISIWKCKEGLVNRLKNFVFYYMQPIYFYIKK